MKRYNPQEIEPKWQQVWEKTNLYQAVDDDKTRPKYYYLMEFPYPSGEGLHVGHVRGFTAMDIMSRHKRMQGYNVLYPIGWDAFGLPTENFAIKHKVAPRVATEKNVANFKRQFKMLGMSFDWSREINTTDPQYYRWTQWIFLQLYKAGLAYQAEIAINWCPHCKTGLANEEVVNGRHERCGTLVEKRLLKQWLLKITAYADRLIDDLKTVDYLDKIAVQQVNWIGRSEGAEVEFTIGKDRVMVFTTRPDTLAGATFLVLAPEHPLVDKITTKTQSEAVEKYVKKVQSETEVDRQDTDRKKTGVWTGAYATNPLTNEKVPVWIADYVLMGYGTGAIMAVPAHDTRDYEFAKAFDLPITRVIDGGELPYVGPGKLVNSGKYDGLSGVEAKHAIVEHLYKEGKAKSKTQYRLRDWIFSRQHYWGEPIPIIHCPKDGIVPIPEDQLPVELPKVDSYEPTDTGESPLAAITDWVNTTCPKCGGPAKRETDTMPNWAGSSWYYLRYADPHDQKAFAAQDLLAYWTPVDLYNGGMEHTTLHLLYSRFWHKFLYDQKLVPTSEPYKRRRSHGMILGPDNQKMSKSRGNVINPDAVVERFGTDALRLYEMFMGPFDEVTAWSDERLAGSSRFLYRVWDLVSKLGDNNNPIENGDSDGIFELEVDRMTHKTIKKVNEDVEIMHFNTMVSALMEYVNFLNTPANLTRLVVPENAMLAQRTARTLTLLIAPVAPHIAEELWNQLGETTSIHASDVWPKYDPELVKDEVVQIAVQVNGKLRATLALPADATEKEMDTAARANETVAKYLANGTVVKTITVPRKLINFVVKP